jgi:hypothetical protein
MCPAIEAAAAAGIMIEIMINTEMTSTETTGLEMKSTETTSTEMTNTETEVTGIEMIGIETTSTEMTGTKTASTRKINIETTSTGKINTEIMTKETGIPEREVKGVFEVPRIVITKTRTIRIEMEKNTETTNIEMTGTEETDIPGRGVIGVFVALVDTTIGKKVNEDIEVQARSPLRIEAATRAPKGILLDTAGSWKGMSRLGATGWRETIPTAAAKVLDPTAQIEGIHPGTTERWMSTTTNTTILTRGKKIQRAVIWMH